MARLIRSCSQNSSIVLLGSPTSGLGGALARFSPLLLRAGGAVRAIASGTVRPTVAAATAGSPGQCLRAFGTASSARIRILRYVYDGINGTTRGAGLIGTASDFGTGGHCGLLFSGTTKTPAYPRHATDIFELFGVCPCASIFLAKPLNFPMEALLVFRRGYLQTPQKALDVRVERVEIL